jgi:ABC-type transport system involved in multi-copper enzyme maturation permease subunit
LVIQMSMLLAIPLMAVCLYWKPQLTPWYMSYTLVFNMLVGPVFSAGSVTSERERETLELLLTTIISPWQILWGKLLSGLRVSSVLTSFLLWPLLLACIMVPYFWSNLLSILAYVGIVAMTCLTTACVALFSSVFFKKTATSLMTTYLVIVLLFCAPLAMNFFANTFFTNSPVTPVIRSLTGTSPFAAAFFVPLEFNTPEMDDLVGSWPHVFSYFVFSATMNACLMGAMIWLFNTRWRVAE